MNKNAYRIAKVTWSLAITCLCFGFVSYAQASDIEEEIIAQVNQERASRGLSEVVKNKLLDKAAFLKAQDMIGNDYFAHTSPSDVDPWHWLEEVEYQYKYAGENLAMDFSSAVSVHKAWMKSKTHRENIVSEKYREIGVAVMEGIIDDREVQVAVQFFGTPLNEKKIITRVEEESSEEESDEDNANSEIKMQEVSVRPWEGTAEDEMIVYTKLSGEPMEVEVQVGKEFFPLEKIQQSKYMNLISLAGINLDAETVMIKARANEKEALYFQVPRGIYAEHIPDEDEEEEEDEALGAVASINPTSLSAQTKAINFQNIALAGFMLVCMILIGNVWILEKEEEKLLEACHA